MTDEDRKTRLRTLLTRIAPPDPQRGEPSFHQLARALNMTRPALQGNLKVGYISSFRIPDFVRVAREQGHADITTETFFPFVRGLEDLTTSDPESGTALV